ncbi:uncharacterized protein Ccn [Drosophila tropicalis]|uniref:uncharacterized protein Ccn n=1 Tax=Drosophila tropicalis TaxID=46794 RepID=UPI0035ABF8C7
MLILLLPLLGIFGHSLVAGVGANLSLGFKVIKLPRHANPANCSVGNTTFAHGVTFKLDCKTQCVCENGRHACSTLCPNEQLPAPEDTISCRSPRLVEVPGHCCKMWLCENPTADVYATCHNSSISGNWTACSQSCGLGIATRQTSTHAGCHQLSNLRLCENRKCAEDNKQQQQQESHLRSNSRSLTQRRQHNMIENQPPAHSHLHSRTHYHHHHHHSYQHHHHYHHHHYHEKQQQQQELQQQEQQQQQQEQHMVLPEEPAHRIRKGHECRSIQRLGPARIRLGECVSRKLYRPKLCGRCHRGIKCCIPAATTTIQVELLCPLNAVDPINYVQQRTQQQRQREHHSVEQSSSSSSSSSSSTSSVELKEQPNAQLWDTVALEPIDQEFLQSHQIQIENKFIAVEWILKCECNKNHCNEDDNDNDNVGGNITNASYNYKNSNSNPNTNSNNNDNNNNNNELSGQNNFAQQENQHFHENNGLVNELTNGNNVVVVGASAVDDDDVADIAAAAAAAAAVAPNDNYENDNNDNDDDGDNNQHNNLDDNNSSSEQQPDIIPYPLSVGETSWKPAKLQQQQWQQQHHHETENEVDGEEEEEEEHQHQQQHLEDKANRKPLKQWQQLT